MEISDSGFFTIFTVFPMIMFIIYGLFVLMVFYCLFLFMKLAHRGIQALDIYLDEKRNRRL